MTYKEACEKDPEIKELFDRYFALMMEAGDFAGRAFALWMKRYRLSSEGSQEVSDHES